VEILPLLFPNTLLPFVDLSLKNNQRINHSTTTQATMADASAPPSQTDDQSAMQGWRQRIDEIDLILVQLFNERTQCAIEIGHIKKRLSLEIYSPKRDSTTLRTGHR